MSEEADIVLFLVDGTKDIDLSHTANLSNVCLILNKIDLLDNTDISNQQNHMEHIVSERDNFISSSMISAEKQDGVDIMLKRLSSIIASLYSPSSEPMITQVRHRVYLEECLKCLRDFSTNKPMEICGEDVRLAANAIGKITGKIDFEEVLDNIFSSFCIGK